MILAFHKIKTYKQAHTQTRVVTTAKSRQKKIKNKNEQKLSSVRKAKVDEGTQRVFNPPTHDKKTTVRKNRNGIKISKVKYYSY